MNNTNSNIWYLCLLQNVAQCLGIWQCFFVLMKVRKEKAIHHTLNMLSLDVTKKCLVAEGWSPIFASKQVSTRVLFFYFLNLHTMMCPFWCPIWITRFWIMTYKSDMLSSFFLQIDCCRSRRHCSGQLLTQTHKLERSSRFCIQKKHHQHISAQTNLHLLFKKLLMHMGEFHPNIVLFCASFYWLLEKIG